MEDYIKIVKNEIRSCCDYLEENCLSIYPFQVNCGYNFQIRMNEDTYSKLSKKYKDILKKYVDLNVYSKYEKDCVIERYRKDFYWLNTDEYIFNYKTEGALCLYTNCTFGYEGLEDYDAEIVFINENTFPMFILLNIELRSDQKPKYILESKKWRDSERVRQEIIKNLKNSPYQNKFTKRMIADYETIKW